MTQPDKKKDYRVLVFSVLMVGALASVIAMYKISRPFVENHNYLNIATIAAAIFITLSYAYAVKVGIPLPGPKTTDK